MFCFNKKYYPNFKSFQILLMTVIINHSHYANAAASIPEIIGHRGGGLWYNAAPENTTAAINSGFNLGMAMGEIDLQYSSDGVPILMHDNEYNAGPNGPLFRTTGVTGFPEDYTFAELQAMNASDYWPFGTYTPLPVPSLEQVINTANGRGRLIIDKKQLGPELGPLIAQHMTDYNLSYDSIYVGVDDFNDINTLHQMMPNADFVLWANSAHNISATPAGFNWTIWSQKGLAGIYVENNSLTREWVNMAHAHNMWVMTSYYNDDFNEPLHAAYAGADYVLTPRITNTANYLNNVVLGDLDSNKILTVADIDVLTAAIQNGETTKNWDINADLQVDAKDINTLIIEFIGTQPGDTNHDGTVNIVDLARLASNFGDNGGWAEGDFNGDETINIQDLALLASYWNSNANTSGIASANELLNQSSITIPEPTSIIGIGMFSCLFIRRKRI